MLQLTAAQCFLVASLVVLVTKQNVVSQRHVLNPRVLWNVGFRTLYMHEHMVYSLQSRWLPGSTSFQTSTCILHDIVHDYVTHSLQAHTMACTDYGVVLIIDIFLHLHVLVHVQ